MKTKIPERSEQLKQGLVDMINWIQDNVRDTKEMVIMEIGSWTGVSAELFAIYFKQVICVDPWAPTEGINTEYDMKEVKRLFDVRMSRYINYMMVPKTSKEASEIVDKNYIYDVIYIDGAHDYKNVKQDILLWKDQCKILAGHDFWPGRFDGVIQAVQETIEEPDCVFSDTSWIKVMR